MAKGRATGDGERPSRFPLWVGAICTLLAVVLFTTTTVPAVAERSRLRRLAEQRRALLQRLEQENGDLRATAAALAWDPQTVLVELDRLGLVPEDLVEDR